MKETARLIYYLGNQLVKEPRIHPRHITVKKYGIKLGACRKSIIMLLQNIPGIGSKKAYSLISEFGSIKNIANATIPQLSKVKGIGNTIATNIFKVINENFK